MNKRDSDHLLNKKEEGKSEDVKSKANRAINKEEIMNLESTD